RDRSSARLRRPVAERRPPPQPGRCRPSAREHPFRVAPNRGVDCHPCRRECRDTMNVTPTALPDVLLIEPKVFSDDRGFFFEAFNKTRFEACGLAAEFPQDNYSHSVRDSVRGLHYQLEHPQGKLVTCLRGEIYDVAVDIR